jgi:hypothetical protein
VLLSAALSVVHVAALAPEPGDQFTFYAVAAATLPVLFIALAVETCISEYRPARTNSD